MPTPTNSLRTSRLVILSGPIYPARTIRRNRFAVAAVSLLAGAVFLKSTPLVTAAPNVIHALTPTTNVWTTDTWSNGVPNAAGDIATYNTAGTATTSLDALITIGDLETGTTTGAIWNITAGGGSFVLDGTGISSANEAFGIAGNAAIASRNMGGNLSIAPNISFGTTALDIGATNTGTVTIGGNITATANNSLNFRGSGTGIVTINGNIGASGSNIAISNLRGSGGNVIINGILGPSVSSVTQGATTNGSGLTLANTNTYTGATNVNVGTLTFANNATAGTVGSSSSSAITVGQTGTAVSAILNLDSSAATTSQTTTRGASLTFNAASGGNGFTSFTQTAAANVTGAKTVDNFTGALTLNTGAYVLPSLTAGTQGYGQLSFGSFVRNAGSAIDFSRGSTSSTVGTTTIASQTAGKNNVTFTTAPTLVGGTLGTTSAGILKGVFVNQTIATYDSSYGVRALASGEMTALAASGQTTQNATLTSGGTLTLTADESVNSLSLGFGLGSGGLTAGAFKLTVTSGVISVGQGSTLGNATVDFGSTEGLILTQNTRTLQINSVLTGSGGVTYVMEGSNAATGFSVLNGANTYTGITRFTGNNNTSARLTNSLALQNSTLDYNNYGGSFIFGNGTTTGQTAYTFGGLQGSQNIGLTNNNTAAQSVTLTIGSAGDSDSTTYSGVLSNGSVVGGSVIKAGSGTLTLTGVNTYTGTTIVSSGTLALGVAKTAATTSGITVNGSGSTLALNASSALATPGATTSTTPGSPVSVAGQVPITLGGGTLLRSGTGVSLGSQSGTAGTVGIGMLTLTAASTIDYGTGVGTLNFNAISGLSGTNTLAIIDYTTTHPGAMGIDGTDDRFIVNQDLSGVLSFITINGTTPTSEITLGNGEFELSIAPVPEPSTWIIGLLVVSTAGFRFLRTRNKAVSAGFSSGLVG